MSNFINDVQGMLAFFFLHLSLLFLPLSKIRLKIKIVSVRLKTNKDKTLN